MSDLEPGTGCVQGTDNWVLNYWDRIGKLERPLMASLTLQELGELNQGCLFHEWRPQTEQSSQPAKPQELVDFEAEQHKVRHWLCLLDVLG